jgi:hypothetical protein
MVSPIRDMNRVEFIVAPDWASCLDIKVDGVALEEHARRAELRSAKDDQQEHLAGAYGGLTPLHAVCWPSRHFLGAPPLPTAEGDTVLLGCDCGDWGCWPLAARVHVTSLTVTWQEFRNGHRPAWDLSRLGPFEFERGQYESALRTTQQVLRPAVIGRQRESPDHQVWALSLSAGLIEAYGNLFPQVDALHARMAVGLAGRLQM